MLIDVVFLLHLLQQLNSHALIKGAASRRSWALSASGSLALQTSSRARRRSIIAILIHLLIAFFFLQIGEFVKNGFQNGYVEVEL